MRRLVVSFAICAISASCAIGCTADAPVDPTTREPATEPCAREFGDKLGVPFVRVCPGDLPGIVTAPFWIAAAPIGCTGGEHGTVLCPPVLALAPTPTGTVSSRTAQVVEASFAHRTCMLRFGGRLPTAAERAQAREAIGAATVIVAETDHPAARRFHSLAEWTTATTCTGPSTLAGCSPAKFPAGGVVDVAWPQLRACNATPAPSPGALIVEPDGEPCPLGATSGGPPCVLASRRVAAHLVYALDCRALTAEEAVHPAPSPSARAAFRCVVPDGALVGTTSR